jgi:hypothetical protein
MQRVHAGNTVEDPMISLAAAGANDEFRHSTCHPQNKAHKKSHHTGALFILKELIQPSAERYFHPPRC